MNPKTITHFLFEIASLRRLTRSHRQLLENVNDNVSDHSFRVTVIGLILAQAEKRDANKVMKMCLFHDLEEARTGDANYINKFYLKRRKAQAQKDQLKGLPIEKEILTLLDEYYQRKTPEAFIAKDADLLDQMVLQQEYLRKDQTNLLIWQNHTQKNLKTRSAKKIVREIRKSNPFEWLYVLAQKNDKNPPQRK